MWKLRACERLIAIGSSKAKIPELRSVVLDWWQAS
jgi:hypothetical protein